MFPDNSNVKMNVILSFKKYSSLFIFLVFFFTYAFGFAQSINIQQKNYSDVRIDDLSDEEILKFKNQADQSGLSQDQFESLLLTRGLKSEELARLKARLSRNPTSPIEKGNVSKPIIESRNQNEPKEKTSLIINPINNGIKNRIFGADLFNNTNLTFEPDLRIPTPKNYILGPDDEILIDIWGFSQQSYTLKISTEGLIRIDKVGPVNVSGLTIEQASARILGRLSQIYVGMKGANPNTFAQVSLGNIKSIKVTLLGEVTKPGSYTLSSLSTIFNALYASGGPAENGSFRQIELIRNSKIVAKLDVYDFLLRGDQRKNIGLQDQDIIKVRNYDVRVEIDGEIKNPGIFEMLPGESLQDLIQFAGNFTNQAYTFRIKVKSITPRERKVSDIEQSLFAEYEPKKGDQFTVAPILERFENRVTISGAVYRPGEFAIYEGLSVKKLIENAEGLQGDAFLSRASITRLRDDLSEEIIAFDLAKLLKGEITDIPLQREDKVLISSIYDLKENYYFNIFGEVQKPGKYNFASGLSLEDAIVQAGGFTEASSTSKVEISRRIKNSADADGGVVSKIFQFDVSRDLSIGDSASGFILEPFDQVSVRRSPTYNIQEQATVNGEVQFPGLYTITNKGEYISDIIKRAGGLTDFAYPSGAFLIRNSPLTDEELKIRRKQIAHLENVTRDSLLIVGEDSLRSGLVGIRLEKIMKSPKSKYDLLVKPGDQISIPTVIQTMEVNGAVLFPISIRVKNNKHAKHYINKAGGFAERAFRRKTYVVYANGTVKGTKKSFMFINSFPRVDPGSQVYVPVKSNRRNLSTQEIIGISTGLSSLALIGVSILTLLK